VCCERPSSGICCSFCCVRLRVLRIRPCCCLSRLTVLSPESSSLCCFEFWRFSHRRSCPTTTSSSSTRTKHEEHEMRTFWRENISLQSITSFICVSQTRSAARACPSSLSISQRSFRGWWRGGGRVEASKTKRNEEKEKKGGRKTRRWMMGDRTHGRSRASLCGVRSVKP
jgi:hypothetical protein